MLNRICLHKDITVFRSIKRAMVWKSYMAVQEVCIAAEKNGFKLEVQYYRIYRGMSVSQGWF
jgi:hypothetical protein